MWSQYLIPETLGQAIDFLEKYGQDARILAGGTDLVLALSEGKIPPVEAVIDITRIPELKQINRTGGEIKIGACSTIGDMQHSALLASVTPILVNAARQLAGPQVRNLATVGGNIINASPAADMTPCLLTLDTIVEIAGQNGLRREMPLLNFLTGYRQTALKTGELVTGFRFEVPPENARFLFRKVQPRRAMAIALMNLAIRLDLEKRKIRKVRIAMGAVAPTAIRLRSVEDYVSGLSLDAVDMEKIPMLAEPDLAPISDFRASRDYRLRVAKDLLQEQLAELLSGEEAGRVG